MRQRVETAPTSPAFAFLPHGEEISATLNYEEFDRRARAIAVMLRQHCAAGDRALLLYPSGLEFLTAFFGCLYAGVIAVPAYPPRANESIRRLAAIVADAGAHVALTTSATLRTSQQLTPEKIGDPKMVLLTTDTVPDSLAADWRRQRIASEALAFLQYTSGSTGQPKGVMLSHRNLLTNQHMIRTACGHEKPIKVGSWLPLFHDMGLIGMALQSVYLGSQCFLMPPAAFLQKPLRWLQLISNQRLTKSGAPNFAYDLCVQRTTVEERAALDLSSWTIAFNGAEPISPQTIERFRAAFAPAGFRASAIGPCYGLAEASLIVTFKRRPDATPTIEKFDPVRLAAHKAVRSSAPSARPLVGAGVAVAGMDVLVVDPVARTPLPDGRVGEIWLRGPSVGRGYWNNPGLTREIFGARLAGRSRVTHLRTGDLGFLRRGELFVTGRIKDVIILRGQNHYPHDFEMTAQAAHPGLRTHGNAAFSVPDGATEAVVVVQEVERTALRRLDVTAVTAAIRAALLREHDVAPLAVVLVKPATLPKTSSGKMQRAACREQFLADALDAVGEWRRDTSPSAKPTVKGAPATIAAAAGNVKRVDLPTLQSWLITRVAGVLNVTAAEIDPRAPLQTLGLDSLAAVALSGELAEHLGRSVAPTVVYDFPTIEQLSRHFSGAPAEVAARATPPAAPEDRDIAIIGMGCRFPGGATSPAAFWDLLRRGGDAVTEIPAERWDVESFYDPDPEKPGRMYVKRGAFLERVDGFDPEFFGIAQRDAVAIDPQHRLLLEVAWEALEDAGVAPASATRHETGVFVGVSFDDYARLAAHSGDTARIDAYSALGAARSLAAARISYHLGLQGPSMLVDTLCSSSLLAVHLAVQSLRHGECRLALAGGANLILSPETTIGSCKLRALAVDGRCKTFDASADGYARGEGAGVVVLKRLRDALADGDPIAAVIRGSAVNHDGKSNGLTAPNALAQEALLRKALADAGAAPGDVGYVEAHGTGTILGDPIEVQALGRVYAAGRAAENPLLLGAVKTNIGHLEAAAGIAGLIKTVFALRHRELPATLHFQKPNPYVPWTDLPLRVVDRTTPWQSASPALAGISSFGLGGTNVHVLLAPAPTVGGTSAPPAALERPQHVFTVSGHNAAAAAANARAWAGHIAAGTDADLADLCHTANTARDSFPFRAGLVVASREDLVGKLQQWADHVGDPAPASAPAVAFLFTGQGSHYAGMARELYGTHPEFRATIDRCDELFRELLPVPLTHALFANDEALIEQTLFAQPAIFAVEMALGRLWLSWGIKPAGVFGHSIGEFAAACIAGVFSLEDAARLVAAKARLTERLPASGAMLVAASSAERLAPKLAAHGEVEFAAFNGPAATTLAGPAGAIAGLVDVLVRAGVKVESLPMNRAFHSRALDPILEEFTAVAAIVKFHAPAIPLITSLHGRSANEEIVTPRYWARQMREPVQFARGVETLARELGCTVFVEVGPKPSLASLGQSVLPRGELSGTWLPSLRPRRPDWSVLLGSLVELYGRGVPVDWASFDRGYARRRLGGCPTYAFQRHRCWLDAPRRSPHSTLSTAPASEEIPTYAVQWQPASLTTRSVAPGAWLLVAHDDQFADLLTPALARRQQTLRPIKPDAPFGPGDAAIKGVIAAGLSVREVFSLARRLVDSGIADARLWLATHQGIGTGNEMTPLTLHAAPLFGFARAFALEQPSHWGGMFDFDTFVESTADAFADELLGQSSEDVTAWRAATRFVPRLEPHALTHDRAGDFHADKTYLITGGTGGLGLAVARWLVTQGARQLVLMSRRGPRGTAAATIAELIACGASVRVIPGDVAFAHELEHVLQQIDAGAAPLAGVFHAAGVAGFEPLTTLTSEAFDAVLAPKIDGAQHLHELTRSRPLDHFVLFSSIASVWGSHGQTHYAAANAFLDALAHERRRLGLSGLSVNWGPWADAGMVAPAAQEQLRRLGLGALAPESAVALLGRLMAGSAPQVTAAHIDWQKLRPALTLRRPQPLLDGFASAPSAPTGRPRSDVLKRIHSVDATQRTAILHDYLQGELARVLGREAGTPIGPEQGFFALGMDSLMAVELRATLETDLELPLPATIAFDRANLAALEAELARVLFVAPAGPAAPASARIVAAAGPLSPTEPIAIVGLACRFPGGVSTPAEFWELLRKGDHGLQPVPRDRWSTEQHYHPDPDHPGTMYVREFGFIRGAELFDHAFFHLYPREAASMDPQQRLLLESAWEALESAGLANARLRGSATGTFVGVSNNDYAQLLLKSGDASRIDAYFGTGNALNAVAGRVAYTFGLRGPTMVTDTACSSSLVALHQACHSLRAGECEQAIVAGVNLMLTPEPAIALSRARMLAPDGRCKTFDASADGYGRGEGCGVIILQPLSVARASGRPILAVVSGSAVNQDGAGSGFTVPNGIAQQELIQRALAQAGRTPLELDYVEAHGTGTPLGDPIEINALAAVVGAERTRPLFVGSVKTNIGHLESAAGIAGVIKTVLALQQGAIPAHLNFSRPSPQIAWDKLPFRVPTALTPWTIAENRPRVAGVSAFGFTGTNAHVILESAPAAVAIDASSGPATPQLVPLSARTAEALLAQRTHVLAWLDAHPATSLADVAQTLGAGRSHYGIRETYLATTTDELREQLRRDLRSVPPAPAPTSLPLAFVCETPGALTAADFWARCGLSPALVIGEHDGLLAAGVLAGIFSRDDATRIAGDHDALAVIALQPPRVSFAHRTLGRITDATASSSDWWKAALADATLSPGERLPPHRELRLDATAEPAARLRAVAELYAAGYEIEWMTIARGRHLPHAPTYPFQRRRHWIEVAAPASAPRVRLRDPDTLLGQRLVLPGTREIRFSTEYSRQCGFMAHHRIFGRMVASAAQQVALLISATHAAFKAEACTLSGIAFSRAIMLTEEEVRPVQLVLQPGEDGTSEARVLSAAPNAGDEWLLHVSATVRPQAEAAPTWSNELDAHATTLDGAETYARLTAAGYTLGPSFCWIQSAQQDGGKIIASLAPLPGTIDPAGYRLHPGFIDSCFQLIGLCAELRPDDLQNGDGIYIPFGIERVHFYRPPASVSLTCHARLTETDHRRTHRLRGDLRMLDAAGTLVCEMVGFEARRASRGVILTDQAASTVERLYHVAWPELPVPVEAPAAGRWSLLGADALASAFATRLITRGASASLEDMPATDATNVVVFLESSLAEPTEQPAARLLALVQALAARPRAPRLWVITRGAQAIDSDHRPPAVATSAAIGLARIAALEHPELRLVLIDLDPTAPAGEEAALERELLAESDENQIALRGARRLGARFVPAPPLPPPTDAPVRLAISQYGNLDTLALQPVARAPLAPGEIEIEVRAVGLNFRDVLSALGLLKAHLSTLGVAAEADLLLGGECAGVVRAVGSGVREFQPGDAVLAGLATGSMGSHVNVDARRVVAKPEHLSFAEGATLPVTYLTAFYALHTLAKLQPGERVLIHAAAGGVGIAAIHVARLLGAEVLATASPAKWPELRALGVTIIGHSRQTDYAREFPRAHVVLNSLVGDHIPLSLDLLYPNGRFVEIGKLGIWTPEQMAARRPDVVYQAFDLMEVSRRSPTAIGDLLQQLAPHWAAGRLPPLPLHVFPLADASAGFRFMAQAKHVGKVVLVRPPSTPPQPRRDGVYLVTGGLGGLGLAVGDWLSRTGAGTIILAGRRSPTPEQEAILATWRTRGTTVEFRAADLAINGAGTELVANCVATCGAVHGVFHTAGVIDDGVIAQQTPERLAGVFAAKARGAWELHNATLTQPLDFFVLFSSLAAVLGSPGQATYAAANATLDAIAQHRHRLGRPALSVNWGPWAEAGMSARLNDRDRARLAAIGLKPLANAAGIQGMLDALARHEPQLAVAEFDRRALLAALGRGRVPPLLRQLAGESSGESAAGSLLSQLRETPAEARAAFVVSALGTRLAAVLGLAAGETLAADRDLTSLGFDSLTAVELKGWIAGEFLVEVPMQQIAGLSLQGLAHAILTDLQLSDPAALTENTAAIEAVMQADAQLPEDVYPQGAIPTLATPRAALLTGATGFLGAFLLDELLRTTAATVHCLVRAANVDEGRSRVLDNLRSYGLTTELAAGRLEIVVGDLAAPRLGLDTAGFDQLAQSIDTIYHNGAWLNFFYPYAALKSANVLGTLEVLRLAVRGRIKPVHYVSTSGVFYSRTYRGLALPETDAAEHCESHVLGYSQSKWVAERLVAAASARGLPVTIHRAPFITGHRETGVWNSDDFICRLVRGIVELGAMPDLAAAMDIVPVDYVAQAIVRLSQDASAAGERFHLCAPGEVSWSALAGWLAENGYAVRREPYSEWLARLPALRNTEHPLAPFLPLFLEKSGPDRPTVPEVFLQSAHARLDGTTTSRRLAESGLHAPAIDSRLWRCYLDALCARDLLPAAPAALSS